MEVRPPQVRLQEARQHLTTGQQRPSPQEHQHAFGGHEPGRGVRVLLFLITWPFFGQKEGEYEGWVEVGSLGGMGLMEEFLPVTTPESEEQIFLILTR